MTKGPEDILRRYDAWEPGTDKHDYRWKLRLLQSLWRKEQGYPAWVGENRKGETITRGAELEECHAEEKLSNYLTQTIRKVVCEEVRDPERSKGKFYKPASGDITISYPVSLSALTSSAS